MTAAELSTRFDIELDAVASAAAPGFTDDEKSSLLTKAQNILIQEYARAKNWNAIYTLVQTSTTSDISSITAYGTKATYIDLNTVYSDFRYYVSSRAQLTRTYPTVSEQKVECELIERDAISKFIVATGINTPYFKYPKVVLEYSSGSSYPILIILVDNYTTVIEANFELTYVRIPNDIDIDESVTSELPENLHKDIVSLAVQEAVRSLYISKTPLTSK